MLAIFLLGAVLLVSAWTDMRRRLIYNSVTFPAAVCGLILNAAGSLLHSPASPSFAIALFPSGWLGAIGLAQALVGGAACFALTLLMYVGGGAGAGDVKLAGLLGIYLGIPWAIFVLMLAFLTAAGTIVPYRIWRSGWRGVIDLFSAVPDTDSGKQSNAVPLGVYYAVGFFLFLGAYRWF